MTATTRTPRTWSSHLASYLAVIGASVGLGSIWRFPYLAGDHGGGVFVLIFALACFLIATPLLVAEMMFGRATRASVPEAAGRFASTSGGSLRWNAIGVLGTLAAFLIDSYYTIIAGWVLRYLWLSATGSLTGLARPQLDRLLADFLEDPWAIGFWQLVFLVLTTLIAAGGLRDGIERANRFRAPAFLILLVLLAGYSLFVGDVRTGLRFAFMPDWSRFTGAGVLAAVGQAFFATGVGMGMMIAYGGYTPPGVSLVRSALVISSSILLASLLATLIVFPLVFSFGVDPAQGPELVFQVLPAMFARMPLGAVVETLFFLLLALAALTPTLAAAEPTISWLEDRFGMSRSRASMTAVVGMWVVGMGSIGSFNRWAHWHPLSWARRFHDMNFYTVVDFVSSDLLLPVGAALTSLLAGWFVTDRSREAELVSEPSWVRRLLVLALRYVCPVAIGAILLVGLLRR